MACMKNSALLPASTVFRDCGCNYIHLFVWMGKKCIGWEATIARTQHPFTFFPASLKTSMEKKTYLKRILHMCTSIAQGFEPTMEAMEVSEEYFIFQMPLKKYL